MHPVGSKGTGVIGLEKQNERNGRTDTLRLVIGQPAISARFLEPKVEIWTALEEQGLALPLMGRI